MPRTEIRPFWRRQTRSWYCQINGKQIALGRDKREAEKRCRELLRNQQALNATTTTVLGLFARYLEWVSKHRAEATYYSARFYLKSFASTISPRLRVEEVRPEHVNDWIENATTWSSTSKHDAITHVQRAFSWSVHERILDIHPLHHIEAKPARRRREIYYTPEQWDDLLGHVGDQNFRDLITFSAETGCRPFEVRIIEARHCHLEHGLVVFHTDESKGERSRRTIVLTDVTVEICRRLCKAHPIGPIFRNTRNRPWTKDAVGCRFQRLGRKLGIQGLCAYGIRHTYATDALLRGLDSVVVAELMGHKDGSQVARTYQHVAKNMEFLKTAARRARDRDAS